MQPDTRRDFIRLAGAALGAAAATRPALAQMPAQMSAQMPAQTPAHAAPPSAAHGGAGASFGIFSVHDFGAAGDGRTIDTPSVNRAIEAAAQAGGGTVLFPAGTYACFSIHLRSSVELRLEPGATILAAEGAQYDPAEPKTAWDAYQDFGHNHWHNSLLWGEDLHDLSITGPGLIHGSGLSKGYGPGPDTNAPGVGNKTIALKNCRNVLLRDFAILQGGWFGILATGVDNLTIDNLLIDTNRDGMDIDCCRNVRISNCTVNSPWDDGICLKSSFALGYARPTENVTITGCYVSGYWVMGTVFDGAWKKYGPQDRVPRTGRIKFGTESNGGFINIAIANCVFEGCQGLALETVDGAHLEDVSITSITMRNIISAPIFLRLGARLRGPKESTTPGTLRRVVIGNIVCWNTAGKYCSILSGIPGTKIEDVTLHDILVVTEGGIAAQDSGAPQQAVPQVPEDEAKYPEPTMFGPMPAYGFYVRHLQGLSMSNIQLKTENPDARPAIILEDVQTARIFGLQAQQNAQTPVIAMHQVESFGIRFSAPLPDADLPQVNTATLPPVRPGM